MKTKYFTSCIGVFEGGGVRAVAYAGAYIAAVEAGIYFNRLAGSSAGSIAAAFIAAGGTPEAIKNKLLELDFAELQRPPEKSQVPFPAPGLAASIMKKIPIEIAKVAGEFICYSGSYSSSGVNEWVEVALKEILVESGKKPLNRPVRFSDLEKPLHVVAADVLQGVPKVWSQETTPDDSVAYAIQASCSIPFFFQPLYNSQSAFIDGGTISNLPSHIFKEHTSYPGRFSEKTVTFRLIASPKKLKTGFVNAKDYVSSIADTVVDSATLIQQSLQDDLYSIDIDTDDVRSTDFDKITAEVKSTLIENGRKAVERFIKSELEIVGCHHIGKTYSGYDERLLAFVFAISEAKKTVWISGSSTYWLYFIYPALAAAIERGVSVVVVADKPSRKHEGDELKRKELLSSLGCQVVSAETIPFTGLIADYPSNLSNAVVTSESGQVGDDFQYGEEQVRLYDNESDQSVIKVLAEAVELTKPEEQKVATHRNTIKIARLDLEVLYGKLKQVSQYSQAKFSIEKVSIDEDLRVLQTQIKQYKLLQIEKLLEQFQANGLELFEPCKYILHDGSESIITPPVLERTPNGLVIIEGHTRIFLLSRLKHTHFHAVMVSEVAAPLPAKPLPFSELKIADETITAKANSSDYKKALFRWIEATVHS